MKSETLTLVLVNLAGIMQRADESLLPGVYKEVGAALHTDPTGLVSLTLFRSTVQSLCYPLATYLDVRHNRAHVIDIVAIFRGLNRIELVIVTPVIQSLVADSNDDHNCRSILGGLFSYLLSSTSFMGIAGWRISFHLIAIISIIVGIIVGLFAKDPRFVNKSSTDGSSLGKSLLLEVKELYQEAKSVIKIPSFQIIVAQGVKKMGDVLSVRFPNVGRIILSQISSGSAIPLAWIILPDDPFTGFKHDMVLFIMASFAPTVVGILSQHVFGYKPIPQGSSLSVEEETDRENDVSLAKALYSAIAILLDLCCFIYTFLYRKKIETEQR
ncbi:hypothetical protein MKX01_012405 [Papaver californicum]|nr:hypothetical protein MKX01_012405 [Papaver californicum]